MSIAPIGPNGLVPLGQGAGLAPARSTEKPPFLDAVEKVLGEANAAQVQADKAVRELAMGEAENLHDVMLAVAKADLAFRTVLEVRNRLTEAYQEVMRMQV